MSSGRPRLKIACPSCGQKMDLSELESFTRINCPRCDSEIIVPRLFGALMLEEPIGSGRSACVYRALDRTLDREVAVKILDEGKSASDTMSETFLASARRSALLNNPAIIPIFSCGEEEGKPYVVMQYMSGRSLADRIRSRRLPEVKTVLRYMMTAARGLQAAYKQDLLHLDVKPSNLLLDGDDNLKIGDFGLHRPPISGMTHDREGDNSATIETLAYLAPERLSSGECTVQGDVFGLGATLYHLISGQLPVKEKSLDAFLAARTAGPSVRTLSEICPGVPQVLNDLVGSMMAFDPNARPSSYDDILERLQQSLAALIAGSSADHPGAGVRVGTDGRLVTKGSAERAGISMVSGRKAGKSSVILNVVLLSSLFLLAALAWRLFAGGSVHPSGPGGDNPDGGGVPQQAISIPGTLSDSGLRELQRHRPRPKGLDFSAVKNELRDYLQQLPQAELMLERERLGFISGSQAYLITLMRHLPYDGGDASSVSLADGSIREGVVPYCNEKGVAIRSPKSDGQLDVVPWENIAFEQFVRFFAFYINVRAGQGGGTGGGPTQAQKQEIAEDCLRLALLCEWYGCQADASRYAGEMMKYDATQEGRLRRLLPAMHLPQ